MSSFFEGYYRKPHVVVLIEHTVTWTPISFREALIRLLSFDHRM